MRIIIGVLGAGNGSRLGADRPKAWVQVLGKPMCQWILDEAKKLNPYRIIVACHEEWRHMLPDWSNISSTPRQGKYLRELFGMIKAGEDADVLLIVHGDAVLVTVEGMQELIALTIESGADFVLPGVKEEACIPEKSVRYIPGKKELRRPNIMAVRPGKIHYGWRLKLILWLMRSNWLSFIGEGFVALGVMGLWGTIKCLCLRLSSDELARRLSRFLGCKAIISSTDWAE